MRSAPRALPERTWWIEPGRLIGGAYPGDLDPRIARDKIAALLDVGIRTFVNLMEARESNRDGVAFAPYAPIAAELARERELEVECARFPIVDQRIPSVAEMRAILAFIDERLALDRPCFVHCWGGRGRSKRCSEEENAAFLHRWSQLYGKLSGRERTAVNRAIYHPQRSHRTCVSSEG